MPPLERGRCSTCGADVALRKNGTVREHSAWGANKASKCEGSGWASRQPANPAGSAAQASQERPEPDSATASVYDDLALVTASHYGTAAVVEGQLVTATSVLDGLKAIRRLRDHLDEWEDRLVAKGRERDPNRWYGYYRRELHSWGAMAEALGVPKQTLHRRHGHGGAG
jgi:hypothetical protein